MCFYTTTCGLAVTGSSKSIFYLFSLLEVIGVVLTIAITDKTQLKNIGYAWLAITITRGLLLLGSIVRFVIHLYDVGLRAFQTFSFWRTIFVVISNLTFTVFFLEVATKGAAFNVIMDLQTATSTQRLEFLIAALHTSVSIIAGIGYSDITPKIWYARLIVLPYFLFVFVINGTLIAAFNNFADKQLKKSHKEAHLSGPESACVNMGHYGMPMVRPMRDQPTVRPLRDF